MLPLIWWDLRQVASSKAPSAASAVSVASVECQAAAPVLPWTKLATAKASLTPCIGKLTPTSCLTSAAAIAKTTRVRASNNQAARQIFTIIENEASSLRRSSEKSRRPGIASQKYKVRVQQCLGQVEQHQETPRAPRSRGHWSEPAVACLLSKEIYQFTTNAIHMGISEFIRALYKL